ncbi:hypothetical protein ES708_03044 [subsurface metagenome]
MYKAKRPVSIIRSSGGYLLVFLLAAVISGTLPAQTVSGSKQYKRVHQEALKLLLDEKYHEVADSMRADIANYPEDLESYFMLTLALAQLGQIDAAAAAMQHAITLGLSPGRFIAGPRELLGSLMDHPDYQLVLEEHSHRPVHGPMVGAVTHTSARFWVRMPGEAKVRVVVENLSDYRDSRKSKPVTAMSETDYTARMEIGNLKPGSTYHYRLQSRSGWRWIDGPSGQFATSPVPGTPSSFTIAFGGGAGFVPQHERMWTTIGLFRPMALLLLGDNVYSDDPETPAMQRYCYYRRQSRPEYRRLLANTPVYAIWDDHDFGTNDCWGGPEIDAPAWKRPVWRLFRQNWINPAYGGGEEQPGTWYDFTIGSVHFIMLDGRYYRTDPNTPDPSMLGPTQLRWLKERLASSKGTFKVVCSPVPWDFRTKGDSKDTWNGFPDEREELFAFIEANRIEGVVLMSADRHRSDAWRIERPNGYDLYEFNSSRLTNQHVHPTMDAAIFSYNEKQSFGLVTFDFSADDPSVAYQVVNIDGDVVESLKLNLRQLTY